MAAYRGRSGEGDALDIRVADKRVADVLAASGHHIQDAVGESGLGEQTRDLSVASGVVEAGLATTVLPEASAGAAFVPSSVSGKLYGVIAAHTPIGRRITIP